MGNAMTRLGCAHHSVNGAHGKDPSDHVPVRAIIPTHFRREREQEEDGAGQRWTEHAEKWSSDVSSSSSRKQNVGGEM